MPEKLLLIGGPGHGQEATYSDGMRDISLVLRRVRCHYLYLRVEHNGWWGGCFVSEWDKSFLTSADKTLILLHHSRKVDSILQQGRDWWSWRIAEEMKRMSWPIPSEMKRVDALVYADWLEEQGAPYAAGRVRRYAGLEHRP